VDTLPSPPAPPAAASGDEALDQLLRQIAEGFFVLTDGHGVLSKWSEPAGMLFGLGADEALREPFFGKLVLRAGLSAEGEAWRAFMETGEVPGARGRLRVDGLRPGGGTFAMEAVFVPVRLDEGFDFSLFLEDLGFQLPPELMLLRMRQQHPVVIRALRGALEAVPRPWDDARTAGTLVAFRALEPTPWLDAAMARREEEEAAEQEAELRLRSEALEAPVQGSDLHALDGARAVIERLHWATGRIEELEEAPSLELVARLEALERTRAQEAADLRAELSSLREHATAARAEAAAAREAAAGARGAGATDERTVHELRAEVHAALATMQELRLGFEEARQAAVAARRDAEQARAAAERAGAAGELATERFAQAWQKLLITPPAPSRPGSGVRAPARPAVAEKATSPERAPREGFDDDPRPLAVLDLKGRYRELNPSFAKLVGYREHEFAKATWPSVLDRPTYAECRAELDAMAAGDRERAEVLASYMHGQGVMVLIRGEVTLVRDAAGKPDHLLMVAEPGWATSD